MNVTLRIADQLPASSIDREIDRLVAAIAAHARSVLPAPVEDAPFAGRDRRRWTAAKALLAAIAEGGRSPAGDELRCAELAALVGRLYDMWPAASTATYLEVHDLGVEPALKALAPARAAQQ